MLSAYQDELTRAQQERREAEQATEVLRSQLDECQKLLRCDESGKPLQPQGQEHGDAGGVQAGSSPALVPVNVKQAMHTPSRLTFRPCPERLGAGAGGCCRRPGTARSGRGGPSQWGCYDLSC